MPFLQIINAQCEPSQFGSSREHIASANAASKGPPTVFLWVLNVHISIVDWNKSVPQFLGFDLDLRLLEVT